MIVQNKCEATLLVHNNNSSTNSGIPNSERILTMLLTRQSNILLVLAMLIVSTACASSTHEDAMRRFVEQTNMTVLGQKNNINDYINPRAGFAVESVQEVQPGVMEYSLVDKLILFVPVEKKCRIIVVVEKETGTMTSWRYNSKPEYCTANR